MNNRFLFPLAAAFLFAGSAAFADPQGAPPQGKPAPQRSEADRCQDRLAHATGQMAFLEAKLALTDQQKPLFERWKKIKLGAAKQAGCPTPPGADASVVDRLKGEEKMLRQRLDEVKAELPALEALAATLSLDQSRTFAMAPHPPHRGGPDRGGPSQEGGLDRPDGPDRNGPAGDNPPPPPEN